MMTQKEYHWAACNRSSATIYVPMAHNKNAEHEQNGEKNRKTKDETSRRTRPFNMVNHVGHVDMERSYKNVIGFHQVVAQKKKRLELLGNLKLGCLVIYRLVTGLWPVSI